MSDSPLPPDRLDDRGHWLAQVKKELGETDPDTVLKATLPGGLSLHTLADDLETTPDAAGFPGLGCQTRGASIRGPEGGCATAPLRDEPRAVDLNSALLEDLENGAQATHIALDRGARLGRGGPQEDAAARGLLLGTAAGWDAALEGVLPAAITLTLDAGANARPLWQLLGGVATFDGQAALHLGHAPLAALARDGRLPGSLDAAWDDAAALIEAADGRADVTPLALDARVWHEAGADAPLELGLLLAEGAEMLRALEARAQAPGTVARNVVLRLALDPDVFPSIALVRAARRTWTQLLANCAVEPLPPTRLHAFEGARSLSKRDPWVNILRTATQAFAALTADADLFTPLSYDRALGAPGRLGRRIARNTPHILQLEGHVTRVLDPAGGSGHVEELTDAIARAAWAIFQDIESQGGLAAGLGDGRIQARVQASCLARRAGLLAGRPALVGVSLFPPEEVAIPAAAPPPEPLEREGGSPSLAELSRALDRGPSAECAPLAPVRDAAPFEEEGRPPLDAAPMAAKPKPKSSANAAVQGESVR